jgi:uncharacterized protein (TIGR04562 family)
MKSEVNEAILEVVLGSRYTIDLPNMNLKSREEALQFIFTYGYDISNYKDSEKLWRTHRTAIEILEEEILDIDESLPAQVRNREELQDLTDLLLAASQTENESLQKYSCAILRVMHIIIQLENDLFTSFTDDIKYQILRPIQEHIFKGEKDSVFLGEDMKLELVDFSIKPLKQTKSGVIKLLAKDDVLAMTLLDRVGVRMITKTVYDIFRVVTYLIENNVISFPHTLGGTVKNLICPVEIYNDVLKEVDFSLDSAEGEKKINDLLNKKVEEWQSRGGEFSTKNKFTSKDFKFLKFISRRFLKIDRGPDKNPLNFFYPFEIQILDKKTHEANEGTQASHAAYKERQRRAARRRVLGFYKKDD